MALSLFPSSFIYTSGSPSPVSRVRPVIIRRVFRSNSITQTLDRSINDASSANYHPQILEHNYVQSLTSNYLGEKYTRRANILKEEVRMMIDKVEEPLVKLELIDTIQRLGISYHFEVEINKILRSMYNDSCTRHKWNKEDLYATSLQFRILRQHGYYVPQDVFHCFKDESDNFNGILCEDTKGMLNLYEASFLSTTGENTLNEARNFTTQHLTDQNLKKKNMDPDLAILVSHALELPLNMRMLRLETRWFIEMYERRRDINSTLLEFAKLDFNMAQASYQDDLKYLSRWWKGTCLGELGFARDNLTENFFWTVGIIFEPQFQYCRRIIAKLFSIYTIIDDVYDEYGTLQELEIFTNAVDRWDINEIDQLPNNIKLCFLAIYNSTNEMAYDVLKEQDYLIISYLKNAWADLCKAYLQEAKWYHNKSTPTFKDYMKNAWISIGAPLVLVHAYFCLTKPIKEEALDCLEKYPNFVQSSSKIMRLLNDLGPSKDELKISDSPKSIKCYMHEVGGSKEEAREHIKHLISENWEKMNEAQFVESPPFNKDFVKASMNLARMAQVMYQHGDGHGLTHMDVNRVVSLLTDPIPL